MNRTLAIVVFLSVVFGVAYADVSGERLASLRAEALAKGWTFNVGENAATGQQLSALCGLRVPLDWRETARFRTFAAKEVLPASFDWRALGGCPPVRNQRGCGSCWAFGTVGPLECSILIKDGITVDLSEQWLVSCNQETDPPHALEKGTWGCEGGWWAHDYHSGFKTDPCGGTGAVLETDFPYTATNAACACPYPHAYGIDDWAFIGPEEGIVDTDAIKQAIMTYGPVSAAVYVGAAFQGYNGGVFGFSEDLEVNHAVVLVGWDDARGTNGAWILRNSWGPNWGVGGYMYIEYGCSNVGFGACYVDYAGRGLGRGPTIVKQPESLLLPLGWFGRLDVAATGIGALHYRWQRDGVDVGSDAPACYIEQVTEADAGSYICEVSDARGSSYSNTATLDIDPLATVPLCSSAMLILALVLCAFAANHTCSYM